MKECLWCICASMLFVGCAGIEEVKPWEKEALAKESMQFGGMHSEVRKFEQHTYFSKEASRGGYGVSGGGCGCN
ncbi:MAG: Phosphonate ABC transporter phosphate-binding periplasmic component (TC 3.A.1.9.1) [uncultured Sulfurovum sp.]|uniref:Phosphonate ABC transporter phosphate-binding periplasmic component (TC 3.A.1.9.1) n=1 Tax=uncultured Sulfurovum sp. TaxID=269237 RepID=A0A6S6TZU7_9BACT|nr:MAG: Phosphonate ABC transporter phosphate-binding periplasmic component (TC 3.A.1.9.1) [uncultured Sulfurovum sp.]